MIRSLASGANISLVDKNGTKKIIPLLWIKSSKKPQIKKFYLVLFLAIKEALAPLASDLIMSERLIQSFRHLKCQNLSISSDFIGRNSWFCKFVTE